MRRSHVPVLAAFALIALGTTAPAASANSFHVECASSHVSHDDPIVYPGRSGVAHRHEFFGARSTNAESTTASLAGSRTSCTAPRDTAAYWVPTVEVRDQLVRGHMTVYYQRAGKRRAAALPRGLRMIAGNMHAASPQSPRVTTWQCVGRAGSAQHRTVPKCRVGERLAAWVKFPDCWDGRNLDSEDHTSHMAYAVRSTCPATHPVALMRVATLVTYPVRPQRPDMVRLAGSVLDPIGMHGDFWNAWHQPTLAQLRWDCIELVASCGEIRRTTG